ncbi:hypothetical protein ASF23_06025 [Curtobacterium sp. Leaf261]|nr:hypothetical protein ASF23_06025 [Curtobacterium sp. Leaf261]
MTSSRTTTTSTSDGHTRFTVPSPVGVSIDAMTSIRAVVRSTLIGDFENEYDEFDLDEDHEVLLRRSVWLEPSW